MLINAQNRIILQTQEPDASAYARQYAASGVTAVDVSQQDPIEHQYARLLCAGKPTDLFSIHPLPWPEPARVDVASYSGPEWQSVVPADSPDPGYDRQVLRLVYDSDRRSRQQLAERLATSLGEREWSKLVERWNAIRAAQRQHILREPGCIPDRLARQQWLSRLLVARPGILAEIEYHRQRPTLAVAAPTGTRAATRTTSAATHSAGGGNLPAERAAQSYPQPNFAIADPDRPTPPDLLPVELFHEEDDATP